MEKKRTKIWTECYTTVANVFRQEVGSFLIERLWSAVLTGTIMKEPVMILEIKIYRCAFFFPRRLLSCLFGWESFQSYSITFSPDWLDQLKERENKALYWRFSFPIYPYIEMDSFSLCWQNEILEHEISYSHTSIFSSQLLFNYLQSTTMQHGILLYNSDNTHVHMHIYLTLCLIIYANYQLLLSPQFSQISLLLSNFEFLALVWMTFLL